VNEIRKINDSFYGSGHALVSSLYSEFSNYEIEIMLQPLSIKNYLKKVIKVQEFDETTYFPISESIMENFFARRISDFDFSSLKYSRDDDLDHISQIISYVGK